MPRCGLGNGESESKCTVGSMSFAWLDFVNTVTAKSSSSYISGDVKLEPICLPARATVWMREYNTMCDVNAIRCYSWDLNA